ncbi:hypothetical protein [Streptomyces sp. YIM S03343]
MTTAGAASAVPAESQTAAVLYVAPDADPGGNGTAEQGLATIDRAQQPAHRLSADSDVVVYLAGGAHPLSQQIGRYTIRRKGIWSVNVGTFQNKHGGLCPDVYGGSNLGRQLDQRLCRNTVGSNQDFTTR